MLNNSLQSYARLKSDLARVWNRILLLLFSITVGTFVLWIAPFSGDIRIAILAFLLIHLLYVFNLYIIVQDGNKSLQWMTVGNQVSERIILQEMLHIQKEAVAKLVHFSLTAGVSLAAFVYQLCEHKWLSVIWLPFLGMSVYQIMTSWADISWSRTAYTYWGEQIPPKL